MFREHRDRGPERQPPSVVDVLDRVLDKGVVVIANVGVSVIGLRLIDLDARVVVSSIDTYVSRSDTIEAVAYARPLRRTRAQEPRANAVPPPPRRRRRMVPGHLKRVVSVIRCADGCSFERSTVSVAADGTLACPYRRGVRCRLDAEAA